MNEWNASRCDAMRDETRRWVQRPAFVRIHRAFVRVRSRRSRRRERARRAVNPRPSARSRDSIRRLATTRAHLFTVVRRVVGHVKI